MAFIEIQENTTYFGSITPHHGEYKTTYSFDNWVEDVTIAHKQFCLAHPYKQGEVNRPFTEPWMLIVLLAGFFSIAFSRSAYQKRFTMLFQTLINWKLSKQIIRYEKVYTHPVNILLTLNFILCVPLFFGISRKWHLSLNEGIEISFLVILFPLLVYLILKLVAYKFTGWLFNIKESIEEYIFQANLFNKYLGVAYLILATLLIYSTIPFNLLFYIGSTILALFFVFQLIRGLIIGLQNGNALFFIILYLCTLEILPWMLLGKWIKSTL